jgi:PAS domain S-box-containing protein
MIRLTNSNYRGNNHVNDESTGKKVSPAPKPSRFRFASILVLVAVCSVAAFVIFDMSRSYHQARRNYQDAIRGLELVGQLQYQMQEARRIVLYALATRDSSKQVEYADQSRAADAQAARTLKESSGLAATSEEAASLRQLETHWKAYLGIRDALIADVLEGRPKIAVDRDLLEGVPAFNAVRDDLAAAQVLFKAKADRLLQEAEVSFRASLLRLILMLVLTVSLAAAAVKVIQKSSLLQVVTASESQLRKSREKFETLVNSIDGVVWEADPYTFRFTFVSRQGEALLGLPLEDWTGKNGFWVDRLSPKDGDSVVKRRREAVADQKPYRTEYRMIAGDGREVWVRESTAVLVEQGTAVLLRGVFVDVTDQKAAEQKVKAMHEELVVASRQAGMAEVATGVLHNVGNVLNSVNVSVGVVHDQLRQSKLSNLTKVVSLLNQKSVDLKKYLFTDPKGKLIPKYIIDATEHLEKERQSLLRETGELAENVSHIKEIVAMQQTYAKVGGLVETLPIAKLIDDALQMNVAAFDRHRIEVVREFQDVPPVAVDRHKLLQILVNLTANAKDALSASVRDDKQLLLKVSANGDNRVRVVVADNGVGIPTENLTRVFVHGFTTKSDGHGFGLHNAALAAKEMGGSLVAQSEGAGKGASFTLELPIAETTN